MSNNIDLIAFGTFGQPNGFRQTLFLGNQKNAASIKTFDLNTNAIKLFSQNEENKNEKVYAIRKESVNGNNAIAYAVYSYAKEKDSDRGGTFIGSGIVFYNKTANENLIVNCLNAFLQNIINNNVKDDKITVIHSDQLKVAKPKDFDKFSFHLKDFGEIDFHSSGKKLVVYSKVSPENISRLFAQALEVLNVYDTVYFTASEATARFVQEKRLFEIIEEKDFNNKTEQVINQAIELLEREKIQLAENKKRYEEVSRQQIETNEKRHKENQKQIDEARGQYEKVINGFNTSIKALDTEKMAISERKKRTGRVKEAINLSNQIIEQTINKNAIKAIALITQPETNVRQGEGNMKSNSIVDKGSHLRNTKQLSRPRIWRAVALLFFVVWLGTLAYFLFFDKTEQAEQVLQEEPQAKHTEIAAIPVVTKQTVTAAELNPQPNAELNENDCRIVANKLSYGSNADSIVRTIFSANPKEIASVYSNQITSYTKLLITLNRNCFDSSDIFRQDTLKHIPSFKKLENERP